MEEVAKVTLVLVLVVAAYRVLLAIAIKGLTVFIGYSKRKVD